MNINLKQVKEKLSGICLDTLAKDTGFAKSKAQKVTPLYFVASFFACIGKQRVSLSRWANSLMLLSGKSVSKQGLDKRLSGSRHADFCKELLGKVIAAKASPAASKISAWGLKFNKILIQDSSNLRLPKGCELDFPGPYSHDGEKITLEQAFVVYQLRWRIEIIFKAWKSGLELQRMFAEFKHLKPTRVKAMIYLTLTYLALFVYPTFQLIQQKATKTLSFIKWVSYLAASPLQDFAQLTQDAWIKHFERSCAYEVRSRRNHGDLIAKLKNG